MMTYFPSAICMMIKHMQTSSDRQIIALC